MLTRQQARKVLKGGAVQLRHEQLECKLPADTPQRIVKQIQRAKRLKKGMRLQVQPHEMIEGSGFLDWLKSLGNMIKTPLKILAPVLKPIAKEVGAPIVSQYTGIPTDVLKQGVDVTASLAGIGVRGRKPKLSDDWNTMMNPQHPVFGRQPMLPAMDMSAVVHRGQGVMFDAKQYQNPFKPVVPNYTAGGRMRGGSFKPGGY